MADIPLSVYSFSTIKLLMHMDGADDGTTFTEESGKTVTRNGAVTKTATKQIGTASAYFDGNDYLSLGSTTDFDLGNTYTISFWAKCNSSDAAVGGLISRGYYSAPNWTGLAFSIRALSSVIRFYLYATTNSNEQYIDATIGDTDWHHWALIRNGTSATVYKDGVSAGTLGSLNTPAASTRLLYFGLWDYSAGDIYFTGYIDEVEIWNGVAKPIGDLYPQTTERYPDGVINAVSTTAFSVTVSPTRIECASCNATTSTTIRASPERLGITIPSVTTITPTPTVNFGIFGSVTLYPTPIGTIQRIVDNIDELIVSGTVDRELTNKMYTATFEFDKNILSSIPDSYFTHTIFKIPDYLGVENIVFCGFFPTSISKYTTANAKDTFTAVDYGFYLTKQYLPDTLLSLQTPTFQSTYQKYRLAYDYCNDPSKNFNVGDRVIGTTYGIVTGSGDSGRVFENHFPDSSEPGHGYLILVDMVGSLHPTEPFFTENEGLNVNGVKIANADGITTNCTGTPEIIYPETWIRRVLGGDDWQKVTGIEPYRIITVSDWDGPSLPAVEFDFQTTQTKMSAIEELAEYCSYIFMVKWRETYTGSGEYRPCAYFVPEDNLDDPAEGLDLPAAAAITYGTDTTVISITLDNRGEEKYNKVTVRCMDFDGIWYEYCKQSDSVAYGNEIPIEYYEENKNLTSQAEATARAEDIYDYYSTNVKTWTIQLRARSDLQLLQKITFTDFHTTYQLPDGDYRIISISHEYSHTTNKTIIRVVPDPEFTAHLKLSRVFTGSIAMMQAVARDELNKLGKVDVGTVTAITGNEISVITERGVIKIGRDAS